MELDQDEATYLLALMIALSDGAISLDESNVIVERLSRRRPISDGRIAELVYAAKQSFASPANIVTHIAAAIPPAARADALELAMDVVWADERMAPTEMAAVHEFADALDIDRRTLDRLISSRSA